MLERDLGIQMLKKGLSCLVLLHPLDVLYDMNSNLDYIQTTFYGVYSRCRTSLLQTGLGLFKITIYLTSKMVYLTIKQSHLLKLIYHSAKKVIQACLISSINLYAEQPCANNFLESIFRLNLVQTHSSLVRQMKRNLLYVFTRFGK